MVVKMQDETADVAIAEFVGLKSKIYSCLIVDNIERKKAKGVNKNFAMTIIYNKYKDVLFNKKCWRHCKNRIQSKDNKIGTYEINKIFCLALMIKYTFKDSGCVGLALVYYS